MDVIKYAQLIWRKNWDDTRNRSTPRVDVGKAVGSRKQNTEKAWLANRYETITKAMRSASQRSHHLLPAADIVAREASHQEEKAYQESKQAGLLVEAFETGALLDEEKADEVHDLVAEAKERMKKTDHERKLQKARTKRKVEGGRPPTAQELAEKRLFVDDGVAGSAALLRDVKRAAKMHKMTLVECRKLADFYITLTPAAPGLRTEWASVLGGRVIMTPEAFTRGHGSCFGYVAASKIKRTVFMSDGFKNCYAKVAKLIRAMSGWVFVEPEASWVKVDIGWLSRAQPGRKHPPLATTSCARGCPEQVGATAHLLRTTSEDFG